MSIEYMKESAHAFVSVNAEVDCIKQSGQAKTSNFNNQACQWKKRLYW